MSETQRILDELKISMRSNEEIELPDRKLGKVERLLKNSIIGLIGLLLFAGLVALIVQGAGA